MTGSLTALMIKRMLFATACGFVIGMERSHRQKHGGVRMHITICCSTCLLMLLAFYASRDVTTYVDVTYLLERVINGIAFLGAAIIMRRKNNFMTGMHTASGIFATSAVGFACGCGMLFIAAVSSVIIIFVQYVIHYIKVDRSVFSIQDIRITTQSTPRVWELLREKQKKYEARVLTYDVTRNSDKTLTLFIRVRTPKAIPTADTLEFLGQHEEIKSIKI